MNVRKWIKLLWGGYICCDWCDGNGVIPKGLEPSVKADALCVECKGTGIVPATEAEE